MAVTYVFKGRVLPDLVELTLDDVPIVAVGPDPSVPQTNFRLTIKDSRITIEATTQVADEEIVDGLFGFAHDFARAAVEVASLEDGVAFTAVIDQVIHPDGRAKSLMMGDKRLARLMTVFKTYSSEEVLELVIADNALTRAMSDVAIMLTWGHYAPIAAGRIADSILRMLTGARTAAGWKQMQQILRVDRPYLQLLTDYAKGPRHGDREAVDGETNQELSKRAWTLMDRYLTYRLGGSASLNPSVFALLKG